jgi:hypothetical protein
LLPRGGREGKRKEEREGRKEKKREKERGKFSKYGNFCGENKI